jgi:hypothetical protein
MSHGWSTLTRSVSEEPASLTLRVSVFHPWLLFLDNKSSFHGDRSQGRLGWHFCRRLFDHTHGFPFPGAETK